VCAEVSETHIASTLKAEKIYPEKRGRKIFPKRGIYLTRYTGHYHHCQEFQPSNLKHGFPLEFAPTRLYTTYSSIKNPLYLPVAVTADFSKNTQIS
jgi:hypothetical protein